MGALKNLISSSGPGDPGSFAREPPSLDQMLISRLGSAHAAASVRERVAYELGVPVDKGRVLTALALSKAGADPERITRSLAWDEFEAFCASTVSAAGYAVQRNVRLRKPTRQIDIVAESTSLVLSVDCKHWKRSLVAAGLETLVAAQAARTRQYAERLDEGGRKAYLPLLLTMMDNQVRVVNGVPIVPMIALRDFLVSVNRFDENFNFLHSDGKEK